MCVRVGLPRSPGASVVCRRRHLKNKKRRVFEFSPTEIPDISGNVAKLWKCFETSSRRFLVLRETEGGGSRMPIATTFRCGKANSNGASFWSSRSEHVQRKLNFTHGLEDLILDFILHENKVLRSDSDVVGVQVHRPKKRAPWAALLLLAIVMDCFSALRHHKEGRRGKLVSENKKKKCLFMVCCREHSAWWSALVKNVSQYCKAFNPMFSRTRRK